MAEQTAIDFIKDQHQQIRNFFNGLGDGKGADAQEQFDDLLRLLAVHETAEEIVIYPTLKQVPGGEQIAEARKEEEDKAKKELQELEKLGASADAFPDRVAAFRAMVESHADAEEREVLPLLAQHVEQGQLESMRQSLIAAEASAPTHPHKTAPESATGNLVMGPFVAIVDRVRDALKSVTSSSS